MTRVLHVLDHSLPLHSGYTFRTRAILKAQQASGLEVCGVTGQRHMHDGPQIEEVDGLTFHRTPNAAIGAGPIAEWRGIGRFADAIEQVFRALFRFISGAADMGKDGLGQLLTHRKKRVQRGQWA